MSKVRIISGLVKYYYFLIEVSFKLKDINSFLAEMDNEMDAMQATILQLTKERELLVAKTRLHESSLPNVDDKKSAEESME